MDDLLPLVTPVPETIEGPRLRLRIYDVADAPALREAVERSRAHLTPWLPWAAAHHQDLHDSARYCARARAEWLLRRDEVSFGIWRRADGALLGGIGLHAIVWEAGRFEIGYWLRGEAQGQGFMSEAVRVLTACLFERLAAVRVEIRCDARNGRSRAVAERSGFRLEGHFRHHGRDADGTLRDTLVLAMIGSDFAAARPSWDVSPPDGMTA